VFRRFRFFQAEAMDKTALSSQATTAASLLVTLTREFFTPDGSLVEEMPLAQLRVCGILYDGPRPMSALSRALGVSVSAMTQIADRLERARLVHRVADGADRRIRCLQLTERGQRLMQSREQARNKRVLTALEQLSPEARSRVLAALEALADACAAARGNRGEAACVAAGGDRVRG
jgi:DNA-binding MarR family transcriptional regulator